MRRRGKYGVKFFRGDRQTDVFGGVDSDQAHPTIRISIDQLAKFWFWWTITNASEDLEFAVFLRERALQYDEREFDNALRTVAKSSLDYINRCGIPYKKHIHPVHTNECIICGWEGADVVTEMSAAMPESRNALGSPIISIQDRLGFLLWRRVKRML
ncbi:hypothetical protein BJ912DRAFT_972560, partial [Pholiota molesta]